MAGIEDCPLDDDIIEHIFSFLPTRDVVKTCVLSRRWRSYWTTVSDLRFSVSSIHDSFVDSVLRLYGRGKVRKFHLDINSDHFCPAKIDSWVGFAIGHQVEELVLDLNIWYDYLYWEQWEGHTLSPLLYDCSWLTRPLFRGCRFPSCESISWSSLKSLSIENVTDDVLQKILMGSPVLEYLTLERPWGAKEIHSGSLRELVIDAYSILSPMHISTPRLLSLRVRVDYFREMIRIVEAPSLLEAELDFNGPTESDFCLLEEMLCKLQNVTRILFGSWCCWKMSDLDSCNVDNESYWHIKKKFKHWAHHLKNVEIVGFYGCLRFKYEEVLTLVKFLLGHAFVLENMVFKVMNGSQHLEVVGSHKLHEVAQRLQCYHRASKHAAVILNYLDEEHGKQQKKEHLCIGHKDA